jgi:hypothetical protein
VSSFLILVFGDSIQFFDPPTLAPTVVSAKKQLTMPPQKKSKKNTPTETNQEEYYNEEDNRIVRNRMPVSLRGGGGELGN